MKQTPPLFCTLRNALCAAGLASVLTGGLLCTAAYAEPAVQDGGAQAPAAAQVAEVSSSQLQELSLAAGQSTSQLVGELQDSLSQGGLASSYVDPAADELPVVPYALGAATALLGIGVFAGVFAAVRHMRRDSEDVTDSGVLLRPIPASSCASLDDTASFVAIIADGGQSSGSSSHMPCDRETTPEPTRAASAAPAPLDSADDLESFAVGYAAAADNVPKGAASPEFTRGTDAYEAALAELSGPVPACDSQSRPKPDPDDGPGGASGHSRSADKVAQAFANTDLTLPFDKVEPASQSLEEFSATAKILATGTGKVHRVTTPSDHLDFSGMDVLSVSGTTYRDAPAANPLIDCDDWRAIALSELRGDVRADDDERPLVSTEELVGLIQTQSQPVRTPKRQNFVAPVIGPGIDPVAAARRQEMMRASSSPAAAFIVNRDEEFLARRAGQGAAIQSAALVPACDGTCKGANSVCDSRSLPVSSARPGPAAGTSSVMSRLEVDVQSREVPAASSFVAPRPPSSSAVVSDRSLSAAVAAASNAYAAFKGYTDAVTSPAIRADAADVSQAAMYASAVYGACEPPRPQASVSSAGSYEASVPCAGEPIASGDAYIDYIVRDEFDHRHDSLSQRNAALGRMKVVSGSACPISVRESVRRHRA